MRAVALAASRWVALAVKRPPAEMEREALLDRAARRYQRLRDEGWSEETIRYRPDLPQVFAECNDPYELGLDPGRLAARSSGRKRKARPKKAEWTRWWPIDPPLPRPSQNSK